VSGGRPPDPSPSSPPSFLSFSQLSFWVEVDFYQFFSLQQAGRKHKHINHRPRRSVLIQDQGEQQALVTTSTAPPSSSTKTSDPTSAPGIWPFQTQSVLEITIQFQMRNSIWRLWGHSEKNT
jgi:hypothetical protein